jgi:glycosyltransferase involved in cell wall biosynthesis
MLRRAGTLSIRHAEEATMAEAPRVSIGVPVFNGEAYLRQALDSLLAQTFSDFELIISDNASTDGTEGICREYAARDSRVRYSRNESNIGMSGNFRRVLELARAPYFKWATYDDVCAPELVERAVAILDSDPSIVLAFGRTQIIDQNGVVIGRHPHDGLRVNAPQPHVRFNELIRVYHWCVQQFGVMRTDVLRQTQLYGSFPQADRVFMAELGLTGRMHQIPEDLFYFRNHQQLSMTLSSRLPLMAWVLDPAKQGKVVFPTWRLYQEWWRVVARARISRSERVKCYLHLLRWPLRGLNAVRLARDIVWAATFMLRRLSARIRASLGATP